MKEVKEKTNYKKLTFWVILLVIVLWSVGFWWSVLLDGFPTKAAERGDLYGGVNALFSGLAFAGLIITLVMQREELIEQRLELVNQRKEMIEANNVNKQGVQAQKTANQLNSDILNQERKSFKLKKIQLEISITQSKIVHHSNLAQFQWEQTHTKTAAYLNHLDEMRKQMNGLSELIEELSELQ